MSNKNIITGDDIVSGTISSSKIRTDVSFDRRPYVPLSAASTGFPLRNPRTTTILSGYDACGGAVYFDGRHIWSGSGFSCTTGYLTKIDPATNTVVSSLDIGANNYTTGITSDGQFIYANTKNGLWKVYQDSNIFFQNLLYGGSEHGTGNIVYTQDGYVWAAITSFRFIKINTVTLFSEATVFSSGVAGDITFDGSNLFCTDSIPSQIYKIDRTTDTISHLVFGGGSGSSQVCFDGVFVWWLRADSGPTYTARKFDPDAFSVASTLTNANLGQGARFDGNTIWTGRGSKIDVRTNVITPIGDLFFGGFPASNMAFDGNFMWGTGLESSVPQLRRWLA